MTGMQHVSHGQWSSRMSFVLAATGSAVGLGNIWKFPYMVGEKGGALFVLVYLCCIVCIGLPLLMAEILMGRRGRQNLVASVRTLSREAGSRDTWSWAAWSMVICGVLILSYYSVIGGWTMAYIIEMFDVGDRSAAAADSQSSFSALLGSPGRMLFWHTLFMGLTIAVVARGLRQGLERAVRVLMPLLLLLLLILLGYATTTSGFGEGVRYLFSPDLSKFKEADVIKGIMLPAMGHAFFTLSLGMGAIMIYGSYLPQKVSIPGLAFFVALLDTLVALLAGLIIFPIVFTHGLEPGAGPSLVFTSMPVAFGLMPFGALLGVLFFALLLVAAWSSSISLLEPAVNLLTEQWTSSRIFSALLIGFIAWFLGILTVLSFNHWAFSFTFIGQEKGNGVFDILDILTSNIMLPLHGLFIAIFVAWIMKRQHCVAELGVSKGAPFQCWYFATRYLAPLAILAIILNWLGVFDIFLH